MERKYKRVVLIGFDGAGTFFREADTPNIDKILQNGSRTYNAITSFPSISAESWGAMLHGVTPECHKMTNSTVGIQRFDPNSPYPSIFRLVKENYPDAKLVSFSVWSPINYGIIEEGLDVYKHSAHDDIMTIDAVEYIMKNDFDLMFFQFDSTDGAGHQNGYGSPKHLEQISIVDGYVGQIYDALEKRGMAEDTLFIISADHGGTPGGVHGGASDAEMYIMIGVAGKTVIKGNMLNDNGISVRDIAAIVLYAFGIECPDTYQAMVPDNLFEGFVPQKTKIERVVPVWKEYNAPLIENETSLDELIANGKLRTVLHFDGNVNDATDRYANITEGGKLAYVDGVIGKAVDLSNGYVNLDKYKIGLDNVSFAFWFKFNGAKQETSIISNRNSNVNGSNGFSFTIDDKGVNFVYGNGSMECRCLYNYPYPEDFVGEWKHVVFTVNHRAQSIIVYYDFKKCDDQLIHSDFANVTFDALDVCIGQNGSCNEPTHLNALMDEMLIFNGALNQDDVNKLKEMHKK